MKLTRALLACFAVPLLLAAAPAAQQQAPAQGDKQPPTFQSGTQVVQVDVRVFDKAGRFVTDLKPEDFEVNEDGVPQPIGALTLVAEPRTENPRTLEPNPRTREPNPRTPEPENPRTPETGVILGVLPSPRP